MGNISLGFPGQNGTTLNTNSNPIQPQAGVNGDTAPGMVTGIVDGVSDLHKRYEDFQKSMGVSSGQARQSAPELEPMNLAPSNLTNQNGDSLAQYIANMLGKGNQRR